MRLIITEKNDSAPSVVSGHVIPTKIDPKELLTGVGPTSNIFLRNCRVKASYADMAAAGDAFSYDSATQFSFGFNGQTFPQADQVLPSQKDIFRYRIFGLTDETDPTIIQRWIDGGYDEGLFGETRKDAGAFYFISSGISVNFTATPLSGVADLIVQFTDTSTGGLITSWDWDFGDGSDHSPDQNPTHTYTHPGSFDVTLICNETYSYTQYNYITTNLIADFSAVPLTGFPPLTVQFTDQTQGKPNGWQWDFGDGVTSDEENSTHTYLQSGVYTVVLTSFYYPPPDRLLKLSLSPIEDTKTKEEYIKVNLSDSVEKFSYVSISPILATYDIAPPPDRMDLRIMYAYGSGSFIPSVKGVRVTLSQQDTMQNSGFSRRQGPTLIFD
jgi:PKD repeat protein